MGVGALVRVGVGVDVAGQGGQRVAVGVLGGGLDVRAEPDTDPFGVGCLFSYPL